MAWFRYKDLDSEDVYPNLRRRINFPIPKENILKDSWLFVDVSGLNIDMFSTLVLSNNVYVKSENSEPDSYIVVYEDNLHDNYFFTPVITQLVGTILYFKAAEDHNKDSGINKGYSLYYKTNNLKLIKKNSTSVYQNSEESLAQFLSSEEDVDIASYIRSPNLGGHYNMSFMNAGVDWDDGISQNTGASLIGTFTGPNFNLYCNKDSSYGKFKIRFLSYDEENKVVLDWQEIDLYSQILQVDSLVFSKTDLLYKKYVFEIVANYEKNILSSNGRINIKNYKFTLDNSLSLQKEEISSSLLGTIMEVRQ